MPCEGVVAGAYSLPRLLRPVHSAQSAPRESLDEPSAQWVDASRREGAARSPRRRPAHSPVKACGRRSLSARRARGAGAPRARARRAPSHTDTRLERRGCSCGCAVAAGRRCAMDAPSLCGRLSARACRASHDDGPAALRQHGSARAASRKRRAACVQPLRQPCATRSACAAAEQRCEGGLGLPHLQAPRRVSTAAIRVCTATKRVSRWQRLDGLSSSPTSFPSALLCLMWTRRCTHAATRPQAHVAARRAGLRERAGRACSWCAGAAAGGLRGGRVHRRRARACRPASGAQ